MQRTGSIVVSLNPTSTTRAVDLAIVKVLTRWLGMNTAYGTWSERKQEQETLIPYNRSVYTHMEPNQKRT